MFSSSHEIAMKHFLIFISLVTELSAASFDLAFKDKLMLGGDEETFHSFLISIFIQVGMLIEEIFNVCI